MELIKVSSLKCTFVRRLNRFVALVNVGGSTGLAHLNNTGRLQEYMVPGRTFYCTKRTSRGKTGYEVLAVDEGPQGAALINTRFQMKAFERAVSAGALPWALGCTISKGAPRLGSSVLDYLLSCNGEDVFVELKSAVMRGPNNEAMYPDCRSERGERQLRDIIDASSRGVKAAVVFVAALPGARYFRPNAEADPEISALLRKAVEAGVLVKAFSIVYVGNSVVLSAPELPVVI